MKLYNTYSEKLETLNLREKISIYVCGITPYDTTHLGHAFTFITYDALIRYLRFLGAHVTYVQNVTDIDDDILIRAKAVGTTWKKLGESETEKHLKNMDALGTLRPDYYPKATDNIEKMIAIIKKLLIKKLAYESHGNVYFEVKKDKNFGKLSKFGYRAMLEIANERGNFPLDRHKRDPLDLVLWQKQHPNEPSWNSPWGKGRPGWHIECSAMSMRYLGPTITIHGGGSDLIFPHHEAEIAQSQNTTGKKFVKIWMHAGMVFYEGKKMSKSLGNMIFVSDLIKKFDATTIRILLLSHNYRLPWNFEDDELTAAQKVSKLFEKYVSKTPLSYQEVSKSAPIFFKNLDNDFCTRQAINTLIKLVKSKKITGDVLNTCLQSIGIIY
ncbi:MAG: cysteine--tRNA ligase [Patescibacteria group bacterium]